MKKNSLIWLIALFVLNLSCGTDTGNPGIRTPLNAGSGNNSNMTMTLVQNVCRRLVTCNDDLDDDRCRLGIYGHSPMVEKVGLDSSRFKNLIDVYEAEIQGLITPSETSNLCLEDLQKLSCDDQRVKLAFEKESPTPFSKSHDLMPESCGSTFF